MSEYDRYIRESKSDSMLQEVSEQRMQYLLLEEKSL